MPLTTDELLDLTNCLDLAMHSRDNQTRKMN